jgi:hypothetical protein
MKKNSRHRPHAEHDPIDLVTALTVRRGRQITQGYTTIRFLSKH